MSGIASSQLQFRPRARIIRTIGDQLISGPEAAVIELVKNAYDADASKVTITFVPPLTPGQGRITVADDGHGMTLSDIQDKWMEPATTTKSSGRLSPVRKRTMMGSKGIGRFAAAKLGGRMILRSVSDRSGEREEIIVGEIDWSIFGGDTYLADISIDYLAQPSAEADGTEIEVRDLNEAWSKEKIERLFVELRRLVSPLDASGADDSFKIFLDLNACTIASAEFDGPALVNGVAAPDESQAGAREPDQVVPFPLLSVCDYEVQGEFDESGRFRGTMEVRRGRQAPVDIDLTFPLQAEEESCGAFGVRFFIFDRETDALKANMAEAGYGNLSAAEARDVLDKVAGIAVYRDGFRVRPYGDIDNDWVRLDRRRVQDHSLRIGHNQIAGYVTVQGQRDSQLLERSSREGFEENGAMRRLRRLIEDMLSEAVEPRRKIFREKAGIARTRTTTFDEVRKLAELKKVRGLISHLPADEQEEAGKLVDREAAMLSERISALEDRHRILEARSSLGSIIAQVLHEGLPPVGYIVETTTRLQKLWQDAIQTGDRAMAARQTFQSKLHNLKESGLRLSVLFEALTPLSGGRRTAPPQFFRPVDPISRVKDLFVGDGIPINISGGADAPQVIGYPDDLATAMTNLIGNAIHWLRQRDVESPAISIDLVASPSELRVVVQDNGDGVPAEFIEKIFDVGFTTKSGGTGLGLNIAREALERSGAKLGFDQNFEGGARFVIIYDRQISGAPK